MPGAMRSAGLKCGFTELTGIVCCGVYAVYMCSQAIKHSKSLHAKRATRKSRLANKSTPAVKIKANLE